MARTGFKVEMIVFQMLVVGCCIHSGTAELFPERVPELQSVEPLMPNMERSVKDCPFTVYPLGGYALASSIFAERYVDKTFSHTARIINGETTCVGLIVDENHVLTTTECVPDDDMLPEVKLFNETLAPFETTELFRNPVYNVTLLRLNSTIKFTVLTVPACFWDVSYKDGFEKIQNIFTAPNGTLAMEETKCSLKNRKECLDALKKTDSILQTRAIASQRMHPFVFSFGSDDEGQALPVSTYVDWLQTVTERKIKPSECVSEYLPFREYEDSMVVRSSDYQSAQHSKSRLTGTSINQFKVRILPKVSETSSKRHCYGSLIGAKFILTAASCLHRYNVDSYAVEMAEQNVYYPTRKHKMHVHTMSRKVHYHPDFNADTLANDIALLELVTPLTEFNKTVVPACIWTYDKLPIDSFQTNGYTPFTDEDDETVRTSQLYATADVLEECVDKEPQHTICAGFPTALVPNTCHNSVGSAMSRSLYSFDRFYEYIFAINSRGENCGFNMPTVFTRIAPYVHWIDSVMFAAKVHYEDDTNYFGDRCKNGDGVDGTCVTLTQCPRLDKDAKNGQSVQNSAGSCSFGMQSEMLVCCTDGDMLRGEAHREQLSQVTEEIDGCKHLYHEFRKNKSPYMVDNFPRYPYLVRIHGNGDRSCNGTLVSKQFVLTTAVCYRRLAEDEVTVVTGNTTRETFTVQQTFKHPQYSDEPTEYNLMLLKLNKPVTVGNETIPACLWPNQTHTPLRLQEVFANPNHTHQYRYPLFNNECQQKYAANITGLQLCVGQDTMFYSPFVRNEEDAGTALVGHFTEGVEEYEVTYLVGMYGAERTVGTAAGEDSDEDSNESEANQPRRPYSVFQRISEYYNWIKHVASLEMQQ